jgi:ParB family chromosome partitioning protein
MVERRLGRGLDFFLSGGRGATPAATPKTESRASSGEETVSLAIGLLQPNPQQPRGPIDPADLTELAASIKANGILQPILARRVGENYEIVAGERRWRAALVAGLDTVPVLVRTITDEESAVFALVENVQRTDLNAMEKARAFRKLQDMLGMTQEEVARKVGLERSTLANFVRLLDLPAEVQALVSRGTLSMGHARALLGLVDQEILVQMADTSIRSNWSVRALEQKVREANEAVAAPDKPARASGAPRARPVWLKELEETLTENLATAVKVRYGRKRSQIVVECGGREEFERLYERLKNA